MVPIAPTFLEFTSQTYYYNDTKKIICHFYPKVWRVKFSVGCACDEIIILANVGMLNTSSFSDL